MSGLYFEEFEIGQVFRHRMRRTITEADNVFFSASADAATFDLQGSLDGKKWEQSDDKKSITLTVDPAQFAKLLPGETRTVTLHVKNFGNVGAVLKSSVEWGSTSFAQDPKVTVSDLAEKLTADGTAGDADAFTLTIEAPKDWSTDNKGKSGVIVVTISGVLSSVNWRTSVLVSCVPSTLPSL
jgi:hypothetical protein